MYQKNNEEEYVVIQYALIGALVGYNAKIYSKSTESKTGLLETLEKSVYFLARMGIAVVR